MERDLNEIIDIDLDDYDLPEFYYYISSQKKRLYRKALEQQAAEEQNADKKVQLEMVTIIDRIWANGTEPEYSC